MEEKVQLTGYQVILNYMRACFPEYDKTSDDRSIVQDWYLTQAAPTPTLLPSLKFHDLVFGNVLGEGAFSTVKYARQVIRVK